MLRTDGMLLPLPEDQFILDRVWMAKSVSGEVCCYFGWRTSVAQALRVITADVPVEVTRLEMRGEDSNWIGLEEALPLKTAGEVVHWLANQSLDVDLINFECRIGDGLELDSHDDTEVSLRGTQEALITQWAEAILVSRGFRAPVILEAMMGNNGKCLAIGWPDRVMGVYDSFDELCKAHRER